MLALAACGSPGASGDTASGRSGRLPSIDIKQADPVIRSELSSKITELKQLEAQIAPRERRYASLEGLLSTLRIAVDRAKATNSSAVPDSRITEVEVQLDEVATELADLYKQADEVRDEIRTAAESLGDAVEDLPPDVRAELDKAIEEDRPRNPYLDPGSLAAPTPTQAPTATPKATATAVPIPTPAPVPSPAPSPEVPAPAPDLPAGNPGQGAPPPPPPPGPPYVPPAPTSGPAEGEPSPTPTSEAGEEDPETTPDPDETPLPEGETATPEPGATETPTPSGSPSPTATPAVTSTASPTPSGSPTPGPSPTATTVPTSTATPGPSPTPTSTPLPTPTAQSSGAYGVNLLQNGGGELNPGAQGVSTIDKPYYWSSVLSLSVVRYGSTGNFPSVAGSGVSEPGANFFAGGPIGLVGTSTITQRIQIGSFSGDVDAGAVQYELSGYLGGFEDQPDRAGLSVNFVNGNGKVIGTATLGPVTVDDRAGQTVLLYVTRTGAIPAGTRRVDVDLKMEGQLGYIDAFADNISFTLTQTVP